MGGIIINVHIYQLPRTMNFAVLRMLPHIPPHKQWRQQRVLMTQAVIASVVVDMNMCLMIWTEKAKYGFIREGALINAQMCAINAQDVPRLNTILKVIIEIRIRIINVGCIRVVCPICVTIGRSTMKIGRAVFVISLQGQDDPNRMLLRLQPNRIAAIFHHHANLRWHSDWVLDKLMVNRLNLSTILVWTYAMQPLMIWHCILHAGIGRILIMKINAQG